MRPDRISIWIGSVCAWNWFRPMLTHRTKRGRICFSSLPLPKNSLKASNACAVFICHIRWAPCSFCRWLHKKHYEFELLRNSWIAEYYWTQEHLFETLPRRECAGCARIIIFAEKILKRRWNIKAIEVSSFWNVGFPLLSRLARFKIMPNTLNYLKPLGSSCVVNVTNMRILIVRSLWFLLKVNL